MKFDYKKVAKKRAKQGIAIGGLFVLINIIFNFLEINILSKIMTVSSVSLMVKKYAILDWLGYGIIDVFSSFSTNLDGFKFWIMVICSIAIIVFMIVLGALLHEFFWNFGIFGFFKRGVSKLGFELFVGMFLATIGLIVLGGLNAFLLYPIVLFFYILIMLIIKIADLVGVIKISEQR